VWQIGGHYQGGIVLSPTAVGGALGLLVGESDGFAIDATTEGGTVAVIDTGTPANDLSNVALNSSNLVNGGTSPKLVHWDSAPFVRTVSAGDIAQSYDAAAGKFGILVEPAATNLSLQSEDFATTWGTNNSTVAANDTTAPDGSTTADKITESGGAGLQNAYQSIAVFSSDTDYALSVYAKAGTQSNIGIYLTKAGGGEEHIHATFNLGTGATGETDVGTTSGTVTSSSITAVGDGWYRCVLVGKITETTGYFCITPLASATGNTFDSSGEVSYTGTGKTIYLWGAQMELGPVATSYIPTVTATATRARDAVNVVLTTTPYSATENTAYLDGKTFAFATEGGFNPRLLSFNDPTNGTTETADFLAFGVTGGQGRWGGDRNAVSQWDMTSLGALALATRFQITGASKVDDYAATLDGAAIATDVSGTMPIGINSMRLGYLTATVAGGGMPMLIYRIVCVPRRVTDGDLPTWRYNF
jgi:hypothetical protein